MTVLRGFAIIGWLLLAIFMYGVIGTLTTWNEL